MNINPSQLKALRIQHGLSCRQLAEKSNVSERTIARIEASESIYEAHKPTPERLADALRVEVAVLAGRPDLGLENDIVGNTPRINPESLKTIRLRKKLSGKKLSRQKLAEQSGVSERQIKRIEDSDTDVIVRPGTLTKLAGALGVDPEMLADTPEQHESLPVLPTQDVQLSTKVDSQVRLAYDLVKHRYGASQKDLINLAPLLYVLLAEGSLARRRQWVEKAEAAMKTLEQVDDEREYLRIEDYRMEESIAAERNSIEKHDHWGYSVETRGWWINMEDNDNQFTEYLLKLSKELNMSGLINYWAREIEDMINDNFGPGINLADPRRGYSESRHSRRYGPRSASGEILEAIFGRFYLDWGVRNYQICQAEMIELSGNSLEALLALVRGDVRIPEIPEEWMVETEKDTRVEWLKSKMSAETQELAARYRELFAKDYGCEFGGELQ